MKRALRPTPKQVRAGFIRHRPELERFLLQLLLAEAGVARVLERTGARAEELAEHAPRKDGELRLFLFRIAAGVAVSEWPGRPAWRESPLPAALVAAAADPDLGPMTAGVRRTPPMAGIAAEHAAFCLAHTIGQLPPRHATAVLLAVWGFRPGEIAEVLDARAAQAATWIEQARTALAGRFRELCALGRKRGRCHDCLTLDRELGAGRGDPLGAGPGGIDERLDLLARRRGDVPGAWHRALVRALDRAAG